MTEPSSSPVTRVNDPRPPRPVRLSLKVPCTPLEAASYLFEPTVLPFWLGRDCQLVPTLKSDAILPDAVVQGRGIRYQAAATGQVVSVAWPQPASDPASAPERAPYHLTVRLQNEMTVTFRLVPCPDGTCRLHIACSKLADADATFAALRVWQGVLNRIERLIRAARRNVSRHRQAILLVHGIGEQQPGQTLRAFVENVFGVKRGAAYFVKPDAISPLFEMRMATVPRSDGHRPTTDVYELYWAHLVRDTSVTQVLGWMKRLLLSPMSIVPSTLRRHIIGLRILCLLSAVLAAAWFLNRDVFPAPVRFAIASLAAVAPLLVLLRTLITQQFLIGYAGDAARYLEARPDNIVRRQEIRQAGVDLINALHDKGRYGRIVVYGHSLGSVIAFDILNRAWAERARRRRSDARVDNRAMRALEDLLNPRSAAQSALGADTAQPLQKAAWMRHRHNGFDWLVSDFVTAGSPLAHAQWLLNLDQYTTFDDLVRERTMPTCPPETETMRAPRPNEFRKVFTFTHAYRSIRNTIGKTRSAQIPHHGGVFALTRWTNLYFPFFGILKGDPVGGPMAPRFGAWIRDRELARVQAFAHTLYTDSASQPEAVRAVTEALDLGCASRLVDQAPRDLQPTVL